MALPLIMFGVLLSICTINQHNLLHISISYLTNMANTVLESQNSFQTTDHLHIQNQYTNTQVQHWSSRPMDGNKYSSKSPQATFPPVLPDCHCKRIFTPCIHLVTVIQSARPGSQPYIFEIEKSLKLNVKTALNLKAVAVVDLFLMRWPMRLLRVIGLKFADCVPFMSRNTKRMPGGIQ